MSFKSSYNLDNGKVTLTITETFIPTVEGRRAEIYLTDPDSTFSVGANIIKLSLLSQIMSRSDNYEKYSRHQTEQAIDDFVERVTSEIYSDPGFFDDIKDALDRTGDPSSDDESLDNELSE